MTPLDEVAICLLNLCRRGVPRNAQDVVVVLHSVGRDESKLFLNEGERKLAGRPTRAGG